MCGVAPLAKSHSVPEAGSETVLFGADYFNPRPGYTAPSVGGHWGNGVSAGIFYRYTYSGWTDAWHYYGVRLGGYPKDSSIPINDIGAPDSPTFGVGIPSDEEAEAFIPGMTKHPDFYDGTKPGYGSWILPSKNIGELWTTEVSGVLKYIPKFYWHPLFKGNGGPSSLLSDDEIEALVPYVDVTKEQMIAVRDKYPYSGVVFASASAFANESEANAQGFILPAAFIDGGKEKNGFFIAPTLTTFSKDSSGNDGWVSFGETYPNSLSKLWRLTSAADQNSLSLPATLTQNAVDAISFPRWYSNNLCCESVYTVAALALISLCAAQYATSTTECAWYSSGGTNFPKGINNNGASDIDDPSVALTTVMNSARGSVFPTTQEGYCKTTHNGRINGITHVNGWLEHPMVGYGYWSGANRLFDCTKHSVSEITTGNVQTDTTMFVPIAYLIGNAWSEESTTPLYTSASGEARRLNCVFSHSSGNTSATFGNDGHNWNSTPIFLCGGDWDYGAGAGVFYRSTDGGGWYHSTDSWGFRVIGYSPLNSDGTSGGGLVPEPEPEEPSVVGTIQVTEHPLFNGTVVTLYKEPKFNYTGQGGVIHVTLHYTDIDLLWDETQARVDHQGRRFYFGTQFYYGDKGEEELLELYPSDQSSINITPEGTGKWRIKGQISTTSPSIGDKTLWIKIGYDGSPVPFDFCLYRCK